MGMVLYGVRNKCGTNICAIGDEKGCELLSFFREQKKRVPGELVKLVKLLDHTAANGPPSNEEKCRLLEDGIHEFKAASLRVTWFWDERRLIVCTHGFVKKKQKTPRSEIDKAKRIHGNYAVAKIAGTVCMKGC